MSARDGRSAESDRRGIRVTVEDLETGDTDSAVIWNNYVLITAGSCEQTYRQISANGTHVLTIKGVGGISVIPPGSTGGAS